MQVETLLDILDTDFFTGVPDSQLKALCDCLIERYGIDGKHHVIAANEGNCTALAAGYHLATGNIPAVYMQNSGEGNIINPVASLLNDKVYGIPMIFIIGWRGEPGQKDEPQHAYQGEVTVRLLEDMAVTPFVITPETGEAQLRKAMNNLRPMLDEGKSIALVIKKGALRYENSVNYFNKHKMSREEIIRHIVAVSGDDAIVSTTGKASRELFELREQSADSHKYDFLTVGSMGHASSIALGIAIHRPEKKIWCLDGDGALLMHMGALAVLGQYRPHNMVHVMINNEAHETVGGMPTVAGGIDFTAIAEGCGYPYAVCVQSPGELDAELTAARERDKLSFIEVKCAIGARADLGRPTTTPMENKQNFMQFLRGTEGETEC